MKLPYSEKLPIEKLSLCFADTTNAYKFYWFQAILDSILEKGNKQISFKEIAIRMISLVWYPLDYYKLSFGKQDGFNKLANLISKFMEVDNSINSPTLFEQINNKLDNNKINIIQNEVSKLLRWVPYRFIRPFFSSQLKALPDFKVNKRIIELANSSKNKSVSPYYFGDSEIIITKYWFDYFQMNQNILRGFIKWNLIKFLQKNNPNVIGLSEKTEKPLKRDMKFARLFWRNYIQEKTTKCIYSNTVLTTNSFSLDHFLPWTFVAHDQIWNIIPTIKSVNSSKNNWLPSLEMYFDSFLRLQFNAIKFHLRNKNIRFVEDYLLFLGVSVNELTNIEISKFRSSFKMRLFPLFETAKNLGFNFPYLYKK